MRRRAVAFVRAKLIERERRFQRKHDPVPLHFRDNARRRDA